MRRLVVGVIGSVSALGVAVASCSGNSPLQEGAEPLDASASDAAFEPIADATTADTQTDVAAGSRDAGADNEVPLVNTCGDGGVVATEVWLADPHLCLTVFADSDVVAAPRQMAFASNGDLFVMRPSFVQVLFDTNHDGAITPDESSLYAQPSTGITHGLAFSPDGSFLYASSDTTVVRWAYKPGDRVATASQEIVVHDMPANGHFTRTLVFDAQGRLYVNVGSAGDLDQGPDLASLRAQVRRFTIPKTLPVEGIAYDAGEVFASGLRNEVGLTFDSKGRMWGVENGSDGSYMPSVTTADNPAEKINRLDAPGARFYGYPDCWTEYGFDGGLGRGTQWAYLTGVRTDTWCRDPANVQGPAFAMQGHWAPLGIAEYTGGSLPWSGDLFIASHGSNARVPAVGRLIARAHLVGEKVMSVTPVVSHLADGGLDEGGWTARPVDIRTGPDGALYFSDDSGYRIFRLGYRPQ